MYLLDTNICIYAMKGNYKNLTNRLLSIPPDEICVSVITLSELEYGASKSNWGERSRQTINAFLANYEVLPFLEKDAVLFGQIRAKLAGEGTPIGLLDAMIGAQGLANNLTVVTHNIREFERIPGLSIEDWT